MLNKILLIAAVLVLIACSWMAHQLGSNTGFARGKAVGIAEATEVWANMPPLTVPGIPETVWVKKDYTGKGKVKPKPVDTLIVCPTIEIDSTIFGDKAEIIRVYSEDVAKNGVEVYWSFPYEESTISRVDTVKLPYPVEIPIPEKRWGVGITFSGGYGFYKAQPDLHIGIGLYYRIW